MRRDKSHPRIKETALSRPEPEAPLPQKGVPSGWDRDPLRGRVPLGEPGNWADLIIYEVPGIEVECYEGAWETLEQMKKQKPVAAKTAATIDMSPRTQEPPPSAGLGA